MAAKTAEKKSEPVQEPVETKPNQAQEAAVQAPEGFEAAGGLEIGGWVKPEKDIVVQGRVVGWIPREGMEPTDPHIPNILIELEKPVKAFKRGKVQVEAQPGEVVGMPMNGSIKQLGLYIEARARVYLLCLGQRELDKKRKMYDWKLFIEKGAKATKRPPLPANAGRNIDYGSFSEPESVETDDGDTIPF